MISKKGQIWGFDLIVAMLIFVMGIASFFVFYLNYSDDVSNVHENLIFEGNAIADSILSEGNPANWNPDNVTAIGILSENKIKGALQYKI
jgi:uncharacterized protein (UPF0333 family)